MEDNASESSDDHHSNQLVINRILYEDRDVASGKMKYLLELRELPLHMATWAFPEDFDDGQILPDWEERKQLIRQGKEIAFDINDYTDAVSRHWEKKGEKRASKRADQLEKRRRNTLAAFQGRIPKQGMRAAVSDSSRQDMVLEEDYQNLPLETDEDVSANSDHENELSDEDNINVAVRPLWKAAHGKQSSTTVSQGLPKLKENTRVSPRQNRKASLKVRQNIELEPPLRQPRARLQASQAPKGDRGAPEAEGSNDTTMSERSQSGSREANGWGTSPNSDGPSQATSGPRAGYRVAPATTRGATRSVLANWDASKPKKRRLAGSIETARDTNKPTLFSKLSTQNSFQKRLQADGTPDPNALQIIDPKTGKTKPSTTLEAEKGVPEIPSAYRRSPPRPRPAENLSPPPPQPTSEEQALDSNAVSARKLYADPRQPIRLKTCQLWLNGTCEYTLQQCSQAHFMIGAKHTRPMDSRRSIWLKDITCFFWQHTGSCGRENRCSFAHEDTGIYAHDPRAPTELTCFFWDRDGYCIKGDRCRYQHHNTGIIAPEPGLRQPLAASMDSSSTRAKAGSGWPDSVTDSAPEVLADLESNVVPDPGTGTNPERRNSTSLPAKEGTIMVRLGEAQQPVSLRVTFEISGILPFTTLVGPSPNMSVLGTVMEADIKFMLEPQPLPPDHCTVSGRITFHSASAAQAKELATLCKVHQCGLLATKAGFDSKMIIYTDAQAQEHDKVSETIMRFRLVGLVSTIDASEPLTLDAAVEPLGFRKTVTNLGQELSVLNVKRFFPQSDKTTHNRTVFLMIPLEYHDELEMCVRFFTSLDSKIYTSSTPGAWSYFRRHCFKSCLIMVHPDVQLWKVPGLHDLLADGGGDIRIFSLGVQKAAAILEARPPRYECLRLFPHGTVFYITDEVFTHFPKEAVELIQLYNSRHKSKPEGGENDRIATRPGLMNWLFSKLENPQPVHLNINWLKLYDAFTKLCDPNDEGHQDLDKPGPTCNLISAPLEDMPTFQRLSQEPGDDALAATDWMVGWFAGWGLENVTQFRRFIVCHASKPVAPRTEMVWNETGQMVVSKIQDAEVDSRGWAKKYQHIGVLSPKECIKLFKK